MQRLHNPPQIDGYHLFWATMHRDIEACVADYIKRGFIVVGRNDVGNDFPLYDPRGEHLLMKIKIEK